MGTWDERIENNEIDAETERQEHRRQKLGDERREGKGGDGGTGRQETDLEGEKTREEAQGQEDRGQRLRDEGRQFRRPGDRRTGTRDLETRE